MYSNVGKQIDGLFLWLSSFVLKEHINVVHGDGIWTTCHTAIPDLQDPTVVFVLGYYIAASGCPSSKSSKKTTWNWLEYHDSIPQMVPYPCVLNRPVVNLAAHCDEIGLEPEGDPSTLFDILLWIVGENYHDDLMPWIHIHQDLLAGPRWWLGAHSLSFDQYIDNMAAEGQCNGLEVWLVSLVSGCLVNVVQDDLIWSTSQEGVDFTQDTFVLTSYSSGVWCLVSPGSGLCGRGTVRGCTRASKIPRCEED